ncbi:MAG: NUDIX domain-containing protein [Patescibacteria group bacterium]
MENNKTIEFLVRAIIIDEQGRILVCRKRGSDYYFFPGGHVEFSESSEQALRREIQEELGLVIESISFVGGTEHKFTEDRIEHHEINLVYKVQVKEIKTESKEDHLEFFLFTKEQLQKGIIFPEILKKHINDNKVFWESAI